MRLAIFETWARWPFCYHLRVGSPIHFLQGLVTRFPIAAAILLSAAASSATDTSQTELTISNAAIQATLQNNGSYHLKFLRTGWVLRGKLPRAVEEVSSHAEDDKIGAFHEISLTFLGGARAASIRLYDSQPIALLEDRWQFAGANEKPFPVFEALPSHLGWLSYQRKEFGTYTFGRLEPEGPWVLFDDSRNTIVISPADHFQISRMERHARGTAESRILSSVGTLPAGFTHGTLIAFGESINQAFATWGDALLALGHKHRPRNDADVVLSRLGYWTDNGAAYYYKYDSTLGYQGTLLALRDEFTRLGIPLGYMQIDSWWYPKGAEQRWNAQGSHLNYGEYVYRADPTLFPQDLAAFHAALGLPLVTHARWVSPASPYHQQFHMSRNVVLDPTYWKATASYLHDAGVVIYEQDWLNDNAQPELNLDDPQTFLGNMATAMQNNKISIQYCMPLPSHYMASTQYPNVETIRPSEDRFKRERWDSFLYDSRLATAVGLWPWADVFYSDELDNLIVATLSGGPAGVGDALGHINATNLMRVMRADGVMMKADTPLVPIDAMYLADARKKDSPMIAEAGSDFGAARIKYVFSYPRKSSVTEASVSLRDLGITGPAFAYNWVTGHGELVPAADNLTLQFKNGWAYYILSPVTESGLALIGEADKIVPLARQRISGLELGQSISVTIEFAKSERSLTITGYSARAPEVKAVGATVESANYDPEARLFTAVIVASPDHSARLVISN